MRTLAIGIDDRSLGDVWRCVGARAATGAHAHALRVVPAARGVHGRGARPRRYAPALTPPPRQAEPLGGQATPPLVPLMLGRGAGERGALRASGLPRVFVLMRAPVLCLCGFVSVRRTNRRHSKALLSHLPSIPPLFYYVSVSNAKYPNSCEKSYRGLNNFNKNNFYTLTVIFWQLL